MKLLLVEDDAKISGAIRRGLEAEGYTVDLATRGDQGLWQATESRFDLIILDVLLPGRNGYQVCAELRAAGDWTPILMLTAKDGELDEAEGPTTISPSHSASRCSWPASGHCFAVPRIVAWLRKQQGIFVSMPTNDECSVAKPRLN